MKLPIFIHPYPLIILLSLTTWLTACGGGSVGSLASGGIDGTGLGVGPVSGFGSIFVNDIEYDTDNTAVLVNGEAASADDLKLGMYVRVLGAQDASTLLGVAEHVEYRDTLIGKVSFVSSNQSFIALGQTVLVTTDTYLYNLNDFSELQAGDWVRVSGPATAGSAATQISATLVERLSALPERQRILSTINNLDATTQSFFNAGLRVSYASATQMPADLRNYMTVEVSGQSDASNAGLFIADSVIEVPRSELAKGSFVQLRGSITRFVSTSDFDVEYCTVTIPDALAQTLNLTLSEGAEVRLSGTNNADGIIEVQQINVINLPAGRDGSSNDLKLRVSGPVHSLQLNARGHWLLNVFGVTSLLSEQSQYADISGANSSYGRSDVRVGDYVSVAGSYDDMQQFAGLKINYEPFVDSSMRQLQGPAIITSAANLQLQIFNVAVQADSDTHYFDTSANTDLQLPPPGTQLLAPSASQIEAAQFFNRAAQLTENLIYVIGPVQGDGVLAKELILLPFKR